jgi:hypothetical protein
MENELSIYDGKPNREELEFRDTALWKIGTALALAIELIGAQGGPPNSAVAARLIDGILNLRALMVFEGVTSRSVLLTEWHLAGASIILRKMYPKLRVDSPKRRCSNLECDVYDPATLELVAESLGQGRHTVRED